MRKQEEYSVERIIKAVMPLGLNEDEIEKVREYLESEHDDPALLEGITPRSIYSFPHKELDTIRNLTASLHKDQENKSLFAKLGNVLFAIGYSTAGDCARYLRIENIRSREGTRVFEGLIEDYKFIAMTAELMVYYLGYDKQEKSVVWQYAQEKPEVCFKAMDYCGLWSHNSMIYIGMSLYHFLFSEGKATEGTKSRFENDFVKNIIDSVANLIQGTSKSDVEIIVDFIRSTPVADAPMDKQVTAACSAARIDENLAALLVPAAALTWEWSRELTLFLRVCAQINLDTVLRVLARRLKMATTDGILIKLEKYLSIDMVEYVTACSVNKLYDTVGRLYKEEKNSFITALSRADIKCFELVMEAIKYNDTEEHARCLNPDSDILREFRRRAADEVASVLPNAKNELRDFLLGSTSAEPLMPHLDDIRSGGFYFSIGRTIDTIKSVCGQDEFTDRLDILLLLTCGYSVVQLIENDKNRRMLSPERFFEIFARMENCCVPRPEQYEVIAAMYNSCYNEEKKKALLECSVGLFSERLNSDRTAEHDIINRSCAVARQMAVYAYAKDSQKYKAELLACAADSSKQVREALIPVLSEQTGWEQEILDMLASKKGALREVAVEVLIRWSAEKYHDQLSKAHEIEKTKKIKDRIAAQLNSSSDGTVQIQATMSINDLVSEMHKGGKRRSLEWLYKDPMPEVRLAEGEKATDEMVQAVMLAYSSMGTKVGISIDAALIASALDKADLELAAQEILSRWLDSGADAKKKWVLYFAAVHGGAPAAEALIQNINQWPLHARGAIAAEAVNALALSPAQSALLTVDALSRKCKFKQVKAAAGKALAFAADQLGITTEELADRIVPDLGFDSRMSRVFDYGTRKFTVRITPALDILITDENGKRLKNMPAVGQKDDQETASRSVEQFKQLKKQIKTVVSTQKLRLELALSSGRRWKVQAWNELFIRNPIMHQFAISLIWGVYDGEKLIDTFRYMEDGSFNTQDEEEYTLPENAIIGLVHPIELAGEQIEAWKQQLEDYEVVQSVEQLSRKTYILDEAEKCAKTLDRFGGKLINGLSLAGRLLGMGWYKGSVQDAGCYYTYYRDDVAKGISVQLRFSGNYVADQDEEITVYDAVFYPTGTISYGSYMYDELKEENCIELSSLPERCVSEVILQLEKATASSTETDSKWREKR